jgi:hypothetical protein
VFTVFEGCYVVAMQAKATSVREKASGMRVIFKKFCRGNPSNNAVYDFLAFGVLQ